MHVLLIDSDQFFIKIFERQLRDAGFEVSVALDGEEGLSLAGRAEPEVIVMGLALPKRDGFSLLEELKQQEQTKAIPIIVYSELGTREDVERCFQLGAADYLIKCQCAPAQAVARIRKIGRV